LTLAILGENVKVAQAVKANHIRVHYAQITPVHIVMQWVMYCSFSIPDAVLKYDINADIVRSEINILLLLLLLRPKIVLPNFKHKRF
jgi:hypothetical protein